MSLPKYVRMGTFKGNTFTGPCLRLIKGTSRYIRDAGQWSVESVRQEGGKLVSISEHSSVDLKELTPCSQR